MVVISPEPTTSPETPKKAQSEKRGRILRLKPGPLRRAVIIAIILVVVFGVGGTFSRIWTEWLWYDEVGYTSVFWTPVWARFLVGLFFAVVSFILVYGSLYAARKISPRLLAPKGGAQTEVSGRPSRRRWPGRIMIIVSAIIAIAIGIIYSSQWEQVFMFLNRGDFGYTDPLFSKDASFFVFTLPVWKMLIDFVGIMMLITFIATAFVYVVDRAMFLSAKSRVRLAPHVKAHLSIILAVAMVAKAGDYMVQSWSLALSPGGVVFGAGYADVNARLPVLHFLAIVSLIAAAIFLANIRYRGWRLPAIALVIMLLTWAIGGKAYPAIIQQYRVAPNEISAETPYIANNIEGTRFAYGLHGITNVASGASDDLTAEDIQANAATIDNIRLWEPRPALSTYSQIQEIRLYYSFTDVDVDRYIIDGKYRQVLIGARELDQDQLQEQSKTWVNQRLTYTHGYGAVVSPVNEAGADGLPLLFLRDIPPRGDTDLTISQPEIYYGELGNEFVVVKTTSPEFDYPQGDSNATATYEGEGGVPIGNRLLRSAFAFRFGDTKLLFSDSLTDESRIMYRRTLEERVQALAPFLTYDADPYMVIRDGGSLVWMWDAYTTSHRFPYSEPRDDGTNYMRNPIKVVIGAYDGDVTFYQIDPEDPIANAWGGIYNGLFTPGEQMPADLRSHMRYPEDFYSVQAQMLGIYHMTNPQIFYNKEDVWEIPSEIYSGEEIPVVPYYEVLALPGETQPEFALMQPFSPLSKQNLAALLVARQDGDHYGELVVIDFPKDKLVFGPSQVEARITNDPVVSSQLTLWDQAGSEVIRGNLLVVPIEDSVMYFEPLYLQAQQSPIPELTRVIISYSDRVVMEPTLSEALVELFGDLGDDGSTGTTLPSGDDPALGEQARELIQQANAYYEDALRAEQRGDEDEYARLLQELGRVLQALEALGR